MFDQFMEMIDGKKMKGLGIFIFLAGFCEYMGYHVFGPGFWTMVGGAGVFTFRDAMDKIIR